MTSQIMGCYFDNNGQVFFYESLEELQHSICLACIFLVLVDFKEFGMIYFFYQISRLSIYIKTAALFE